MKRRRRSIRKRNRQRRNTVFVAPEKGSKEAIHIVSPFATRQRIVVSQVKVNEKSNEVVAIPTLLDMM